MLTLEAGPVRAMISAHVGGRLASLRIGDLEVLVTEGDGPLAWGCYPMVPWAGRLAHGRFRHGGEVIQLPTNLAPHAIHGLGTDRAWDTLLVTTGRADLALDLSPLWPLGGRATVSYRLDADRLRATLTLEAGLAPLPGSLGFHPWFARQLGRGATVESDFGIGPTTERYERGTDHLPTGRRVPVGPATGPWDDCFLGSLLGRLRWPGALELVLGHDGACTVVYDEPEHALCIEPQSAPPDALNRAGWAAVVEPGRPLALTMLLTWTDRPA